MKRSEMVQMLKNIVFMASQDDIHFNDIEASELLNRLEHVGMKPPRLPEEYCQAIMTVYYAGFSFYQWEEDVEKDVQVMETLKRRRNPIKTPKRLSRNRTNTKNPKV